MRKVLVIGSIALLVFVASFWVSQAQGSPSNSASLASLVETLSNIVARLKDIIASIPRTRLVAQVAPPTNGLTGYWPMDEGSGGTTADSSGNGSTGAVNGNYFFFDSPDFQNSTAQGNLTSHSNLLTGWNFAKSGN